MANFISFITENWPQLVAIVTGLLTVAGIIAKFTPTPADDAIIAQILNFFNLLPTSAKAKLEEGKSEDGPTPLL